ncbi:hypothetical protein ABZS66_11140 [Dactylosporangium sp. NPDC005572]|uniref:hypothetical protein n=1 Tax=Dactylosporangium sp. NPDC005572 TaxID=3156889 RepID=UPI0033AD515A
MTVDVAEATPEVQAEPSILYTVYLSSADELIEHIRAADVLNLGFRVESYLVTTEVSAEDAAESTQTEFEFTLFAEQPAREDDRD